MPEEEATERQRQDVGRSGESCRARDLVERSRKIPAGFVLPGSCQRRLPSPTGRRQMLLRR
jgi:hypothetical protein